MYKRIKIPIINEVTCKVKVTKLAQQIFISLHSIKSYHICIIVVPSNFSSRTHSLYFLLSYLAPRSKYLKYNNIYSNRIGRNAIIKIIARGEAECKLFWLLHEAKLNEITGIITFLPIRFRYYRMTKCDYEAYCNVSYFYCTVQLWKLLHLQKFLNLSFFSKLVDERW